MISLKLKLFSKALIVLGIFLFFSFLFFLGPGKSIFRQEEKQNTPVLSSSTIAYIDPTPMVQPVSEKTTKELIFNNLSAPSNNSSDFSELVPVLMYHYVDLPPATSTLKGLYIDPQVFEKQLQELIRNNYRSLFVYELAASLHSAKELEGKNILLTFDDGYEDFYISVFPLLKKYNIKATLYVVINALGTKGYLTREQVRELASSGLVEIGSHTFNHKNLLVLKKKDAKFEIQESKKILEQISGQPVLSFAYPFGAYKTDFFPLVSATGYKAAVSVIPGSRHSINNVWLLSRLRPGNRVGEDFSSWLTRWSR